MKIAITGATGFVGTRLVEKLQSEGEQIIIFVRNQNKAENLFPKSKFPDVEIVLYNALESGLWQDKINGCDVIVNLAGEPIAERWTFEYKKAIIDSRKLGTEKIVEAISKANIKPSVLINSSAIGYYGISETADFIEESPSGKDFLAQVCVDWEKAANKAQEIGTRVVILRTGIVLGMGGAIAKMLTPFKLFTGGAIGSGKQWVSWIHRDDLVNLILFSIKNTQISGVLNATSPNPVKMGELANKLGEILNRPAWLPVPDVALKLLLGDAAIVVLEGQKVLPQKTLKVGFEFQYTEIKSALGEFLS